MGKCFRKEILEIPNTYEAVFAEDVAAIKSFLNISRKIPMLLIGSGGSFSVAVAAEYLLRRAGFFCKAITPLELPQYRSQMTEITAILFTASGRNSDTKNAFNFLCESEMHALLTVCMSKNAPISKIQLADVHSRYFDFFVPSGKDGYLAVNSMIASIALLAKAIYELTGDVFFQLKENGLQKSNKYSLENDEFDFLKKDTLIVLHGGSTTPVAYDIESKFSEVALGNIQLVDYRNFAHGRHYWIAQRKANTAVLMLIGSGEKVIANKTLEILPADLLCKTIFMEEDSVVGMLNLYYEVFDLIAIAGELNGIDPGRPKVPDYGRKLYHLSANPCRKREHQRRKKTVIEVAVQRKITDGACANQHLYNHAAEKYLQKLREKQFQGLVFDYDGTLHIKGNATRDIECEIFKYLNDLLEAGIRIGVATGRGKSVRKELQEKIGKKHWDKFAIAYYNGGCVAALADDLQPNTGIKVNESLWKLKTAIDGLPINSQALIDLRPTQLTIAGNDAKDIKFYTDFCKEKLFEISGLKMVVSSHSVDVIPENVTKSNIMQFFGANNDISKEYLFIGDSGQIGGNDFEMLKEEYSLSVDQVSKSLDTCWNFAPAGKRNLLATRYYLECISLTKDAPTFNVVLC